VQEVEERSRELFGAWRAESDRIGHARIDRLAVVRIVRRQVEHVAGDEHIGVRRGEALENFKRQSRPQRHVFLPAVSPPAPTHALQQEYIIRVDVGPHPAARRGVTHHQVVEARIRNEREAPQQRVARGTHQVDALHEQRPVSFRKRREVGATKWPMLERPA